MNIANILDEIEKVDGEIYDRISPRRKAMKDFFRVGSKVAIVAAPMAIGSMFKKAYGQTTPAGIINVLQYALTLEHFEYRFYERGAALAPITAGAERTAIEAIRDSEKKHVDFLRTVITAAGATPVAEKAAYDFTAGNTFPTVFTSYPVFLAVAQVLEDTGVRAYKGRAGELAGQKVYLTAALGIHAVEARHAAKIRYMRRTNGAPATKPYITGGNDTGVPAANGNYGGATPESNVVQAGITITNINGLPISANAATEAFDEPLTTAEVLALVAPFGVS
ncbi:ferritin-like domain-containing protein [Segetibacter sp. 3557_3]|uniref:ferritin-like domain-containing protein n=1 Tax=Segetibacter sp. 3557_3 TaxID=2547429 RepID=UPI0010591518|nr:ferritin-like domain-containing protein [Segetibacter sp. 3557_3]TDH29123.1 ferritin-like domain-containing protein [Segetibacter sp. 3557_3]